MTHVHRTRRRTVRGWALLGLLLLILLPAAPAQAAPAGLTAAQAGVPLTDLLPDTTTVDGTGDGTEENTEDGAGTTSTDRTPGTTGPGGPSGPRGVGQGDSGVTINLDGLADKPSSSVTLLLTLTMLSLLPAILLTCTSFTKILVVLGLTRNALGLQQTPPNQVLAGLALFLSLFIMAPVISEINDVGVQPYINGQLSAAAAYESGVDPLREFMLDQTDDEELALLTQVAGRDLPENRADVSMTTLVPAFILSELKQAFIIGFIIFIPFLVIDIVVSGALMALGMMMMPPVMVSLPFKLLLFVLVDGWALVIKSLVASYA